MVETESTLEPAEVIEAIRKLAPGQQSWLLFKAWNFVGGLSMSGDELLSEAIIKAVEGERKCPKGVNVVTFLYNAMRSMASHAREKESLSLSGGEIEQTAGEEWSVEATIRAHDFLTSIEKHFEDDPLVLDVLNTRHEGWSKAEACELMGVSAQEYDAANKRLQRRAHQMLREDL